MNGASLPADLSAVPDTMRARDQWLMWRLESKEGDKKPRKVPYYVSGNRRTDEQGSEADRASLTRFDAVCAELAGGKYSGVGFAFLPGDGLIGIDIDGVINRETGEVSERATQIIEACNSYTEYTPSREGVHIIVEGATSTFKSNAIGLEVFCGHQYFTVTGARYPGTPRQVSAIDPVVLGRLRKTVDLAKEKRSSPGVPPVVDSASKIEAALAYLSPECGYDDWIKIGMAIHAEGGAFQVWNSWSAKGSSYPGEKAMATHWKSFKPGNGITGATLYKRAMLAGWQHPVAAVPKIPPPVEQPIADVWGEPIMPGAKPTPDIPAGILPGIFGAHAAAVAESTQTPPAISVMFTLSILATVLQGRFEVAPYGDEYREPLAIWTVTCYPVGGRKTAVFNAGVSPILRWEKLAGDRSRDEINRRFAAREVAIKRIERLKQDAAREDDVDRRGKIQDEIKRERQEMPEEMEAPRCFTGNATPERTEGMLTEQNGKLAILSDESDTFLNFNGGLRGGMAGLDVNLKGHAGSALRVDRQGRKAHLDRPTLSVGLIVQPESFAELAAGKRLRSTGLLARFLYAIPKSNIGSRNVRMHKQVPRDITEGYHHAVMSLLEGYEVRGNEPRILPFTADALELWLSFAEGIEQHQGEGGRFETISDWTSKLPGHAARLAALFQIAEHGLAVTEVGGDAVERSLELCRLLIRHAEAAFSMLGADDADADAQAVLRWIKAGERKQFTRREAQRAMHSRFSKVERLEGALASLRDNYILSGEKKEKTGGRASAFYLVNPKLFSMKVAA